MIDKTDPRYPAVNNAWARYAELTRFLESARIAFEREHALWRSSEFVNAESIKIKATSIGGKGRYTVRIGQHMEAVANLETLCGLVLLGICSAAEDLARIALGVDRLPLGGVEVWGEDALALSGSGLSKIHGGKPAIVFTYVTRNAVAHGHEAWSTQMATRVQDAGGTAPTVGSPVLVAGGFEEHRASLRSFMRNTGLTTQS